ncbi:MAG: tRNA guanosine(34) transglycosylase Tgt [Holosporales bacterium]|jgi:queuine tRNA-ribosyltransferase|nr:tRNA guanosine(34) transglycosylase Tgt [Holosporales bacterium]
MLSALYPEFRFLVRKTEAATRARRGCIITPHGVIETPAFIFCGTKASVKGLSPALLKEAETQCCLANTYHLMLQPGADTIQKVGGLHAFMGWNGPLLTDSGGFQVFSLGYGSVADEIKGRRQRSSSVQQISEKGVVFKSYLDGSLREITPETSIQIQRKIGADLVVAFDECTPYHCSRAYTEQALERSHRWETRSLDAFKAYNDGKQALYGVVQGGVYVDLREKSARYVKESPFFGHAIGGTLGAIKEEMYRVIEMTMNHLISAHPVHLLGIGGIRDIFVGVSLGIDTFDCVHPTRIARHGGALVPISLRDHPAREHISLKRASYAEDSSPIDPTCSCATCQQFSRAYLHHLLKAREVLAITALTLHNVFFMNRLMEDIRAALEKNCFTKLCHKWQVSDL